MRVFFLSIVASVLPFAFMAMDRAETSAGVAEILPLAPIGADALYLADAPVDLPLAVDHLDIAAQDGNLLLILLASGGTACPKMWAYVDAGADPVWVSEPFGTCHDNAQAQMTERGIEVISPATDPGQSGDLRYWLEGREIHEARAPSKSLGFTQVAQWEGRHPKLLVNDPAWEGRFLAAVGPIGLLELRALFEQASVLEWEGDWLVAQGCKANACGHLKGALAMRRDGHALVAVIGRAAADPLAGLRIYGDAQNQPLPQAIIQVFAGHVE
ncbi:hypothetical protein [Celeribacter sp. PS-C1]|uniref:hypothetical protein n=1 Tax=Celeribacter sp. PS-C1 TaxID=2820813 RepID=UPI001CA4F3C4|nr:hypothetical protein [Celeribacter sp. PS-C1]MBW6419046.1 hypothetical protein [Celeribacter sp. PS-C1]